MLQNFGSSVLEPTKATTNMDPEAESGNSSVRLGVLALKFNPIFAYLADGKAAERLVQATPISAIEFSKVDYTRKKVHILDNVSGHTRPGLLTAITGPAKSGKTKLLNALAGTVQASSNRHQTLRGQFVTDKGEQLFSVMRPGFVPKLENLNITGSVREEIEFSAALRLPSSVPKSEKDAIISDLLKSLGLEEEQNKLVRALTKSQKKLLAIAIELVALPNVLFLDEPTSGLEPVAAWEVMATLKALAMTRVCTVICSLAQPTSELAAMVGHLILMSQGHVIFDGSPSEILSTFSAKGLACPPEHSPLDFALICARLIPIESLPSGTSSPAPSTGNGAKQLGEGKESFAPMVTQDAILNRFNLRSRHRNMFVEFRYLLIRELRATKRDPRLLMGRIILSLIIFALCACVFLGVGQYGSNYFIGSHFGSFVFVMFTSCFGAMIPNVMYIYDTRGVYVRERAQGIYSTVPYVMARVIPELFVNFLVAILATVIMYWSANWHGNIGLIMVAFWLLLLSCMSYAYCLAMIFKSSNAAVGMVAFLLVPQLLFMGTFVRITTMPVWLSWISYICNITYALRMIQSIEFIQEYCGDPHSQICTFWKALAAGNDVNPDNLWWYALVLVAFFIFFRFVAFFAIRRNIMNASRFGEL